MINIKSTENISALEAQWVEAKDASSRWVEHQYLIEGRVLELIPQETFIQELPAKGTLRLDTLDVKFAQTRTWNQAKLALLINDFPWLLQNLFRIEYACASNPRLDKFLKAGDAEGIGQRLLECFETKDRKPSFSKR